MKPPANFDKQSDKIDISNVARQFLVALQFLTILPIKIFPVGGKSEIKKEDFGKSLLYFPIVGILIGVLLALCSFILMSLSPFVKSASLLIISIITTGAIHLDGFADTCDGFYGSKSKNRILEIMRDSQIGAMGVVGVAALLLLKFALIASVPQDVLWKSLIMMAVFARWSQVLACYTSNYARKEGKAKYFIEYDSKKEFIAGTFIAISIFYILMKLKGVILFVISLFPIVLFMNYTKRKIGGMTGDTIGATNEIAEAAALFSALLFG